MPATVESPRPETTNLAGGTEQSFNTHELASESEQDESVISGKASFAISRIFVGQSIRCLNLPLKTRDIDGLVNYLSRSPEANRMVELTFEALRHFFQEPIRLEVYRDPEGEREPELALFVETTDRPKRALQRLDEFDEAFWLHHVEQFGRHLSVHMDYQ